MGGQAKAILGEGGRAAWDGNANVIWIVSTFTNECGLRVSGRGTRFAGGGASGNRRGGVVGGGVWEESATVSGN